jgi:hypothetical protein
MRFKVSSSVEEIKKAYSAAGDVVEELEKAGIYLPPRPQDSEGSALDPILPPDLSVLSLNDLAKLHTEFTNYADYVSGRLALAIKDRAIAQGFQRAVWAKLRSVKEGDNKEKDDQVQVDPQFLEAEADSIRGACMVALIEAVMNRCNKDLKVISRTISGIISEQERVARNSNLGFRGALRRPAPFRRPVLREEGSDEAAG